EQRSHPRQALCLRRVAVEAADGDNLGSCANREQHLGHRWNQRDDPLWRRLGEEHGVTGERDAQQRAARARRYRFLTSSHRKNGPPISVSMTPTGSSTGAITVRDSTSHPMRNAAPKSAAAGSTSR